AADAPPDSAGPTAEDATALAAGAGAGALAATGSTTADSIAETARDQELQPRLPTRAQPAARRPEAVPAPPEPDEPFEPPPRQPEQPPLRKPTEEVIRHAPPPPPPPERPEAQPGDLICGNCGTPNDPSRHFCKACGRSLATAVPVRKRPWWRRFFPERKPLAAGERSARLRSAEAGRRGGVGRGIRTTLSMLLVLLVAFAVVGYLAVPGIHRAVDSAIKGIVRNFEQPEQIYPVAGSASDSIADHGPDLAFDKTYNLYWAGPLEPSPPSIEFSFNQPTDVVALLVTPGALDAPTDYARPKDIRITFSDGTSHEVTLDDATLVNAENGQGKRLAAQTVGVSGNGTTSVKLEILSVYDGTTPAVAVAEVEFFTKP
ncbi:MAG: hypothetical protein ACAH65_06530, partial [Chloroflexota bacterium]